MWKLALSRLRSLNRIHKALEHERQRGDRLEIAIRRQHLKHDELSADLERLSERLAALAGRLGGRPPKARQLALPDMDPSERKAALREMIRTGNLKQE